MLTTRRSRLRKRRGVALILILGMLGLLALIGVTFATFTGQARVSARNYAQSVLRPQPNELMDYALSQLIGDTNDVRSAIRGHSLARDMYGNDAANNGYVDYNPANTVNGQLQILSAALVTDTGDPMFGMIKAETNIPVGLPAFYGYDFTRWVVKFESTPAITGGTEYLLVGQTFEVLVDDVSGANRVFYLTPPATTSPMGVRSGYASPDIVYGAPAVTESQLIGEHAGGVPPGIGFVLDGRFLRAFNGPGLGYTSATQAPGPGNMAHLANMRYNGGLWAGDASIVAAGDPNALPGMDEDYDAADVENWFLAIQSADGKVIIPSFHRPGILGYYGPPPGPGLPEDTDWTRMTAESRSKILRPRRIDGHSRSSFPDLRPNPTDGRIEYDVDNDGDGLTDSVWVDLGYPAIKDSRGMLYKPLFAFMVIGLNGRIPLNTAGNLQSRGSGGSVQRHMHTARLGVSPSEVDPTFGLQNAPPIVTGVDPMTGLPIYGDVYPQFDDAVNGDGQLAPVGVNVTQLRNILAGARPDPHGDYGDVNVLTTVHPDGSTSGYFLPNNLPDDGGENYASALAPRAVPGRWGEAGSIPSIFNVADPADLMSYQNPVRAGVSTPTLPSDAADGRDGNHTAFDYWPTPNTGEDADYYDAAGDFALPVERIRRFVTPFDLFGDGRVGKFDAAGTAGSDEFGRVAFDRYFRPPGVPVATAADIPVPTTPPSATVVGVPSPIDVTNNPLRGFESHRNPLAGGNANNNARDALRFGATPTNLDQNGDPVEDVDGNLIVTSGGQTIPTYNSVINSMRMGRGISEADEMNLYKPGSADDPFGHQDLEWLYRAHDREGPSLFSRLAELAPVSFRDSVDAQRRRRLYSIDAWETNAIVWANDNPHGRFSDNSRFTNIENASLKTLAENHNVPFVGAAGSSVGQSSAPSLAHRDRKINLNYPLPVSNDPDEPTRRKWITESYQLLKTMLPPLSLDTPDELAMLSQFLVNIIDFRDPDATMTRFVNPDVFIRPGTATAPPTLIWATDADTAGTPPDMPLVQYGMEYNPVAINEVLAYSFQSSLAGGGTQQPVGRFFIELVNTLTEARGSTASTLNLGGFAFTAGNPYAGGCWDLIFADDEPHTRPDPFTGQLLPVVGGLGHYAPTPLNRESFVAGTADVNLIPLDKAGVPPAPATQPTPPVNYFHTIGNSLAVPASERNTPATNYPDANNPSLIQTLKPEFDPLAQATPAAPPTITLPEGVLPMVDGAPATTYPAQRIAAPALGTAEYKWVCLRRPVNPFAPVSADNPMVVVDSMRFHFIEGTGKDTIDTDDGPVPNPDTANRIYSTQRYQPYRGGHAVRVDPTTDKVDPRYGYTEQLNATATNPGAAGTQTQGVYAENSQDANLPHFATSEIFHSLGRIGNDNGERDTSWDYFVFNDRDFVSPAELMLVPGCPPGLFTKQFVEFAPYSAHAAKFPTTVPTEPAPLVNASPNLGDKMSNEPRSHPYLVDRLFYTSASPALNGATTWDPVRGPSAGGWYKMFEVFEVPSRAGGAVASAAHGYNYDWLRQDVRPGQLNLNLIIDEEVFLGLMGNAGKRTDSPPTNDDGMGGQIPVQQVRSVPSALNGDALPIETPAVLGPNAGNPIPSADPSGFNAGRNFTPLVVTEWDPADDTSIFGEVGSPTALSTLQRAAYPPSNVGFFHHDETGAGMSTLKAAFSDFLKIRHGGSGYMFGPLPEAPFRSLTYPDINYTIMRPAFSTLNVGKPDPDDNTLINYYVPKEHGLVKQDAGVKNPDLLDPSPTAVVYPPAIPPRRLFQLTDEDVNSNAGRQGEPMQLGYTVPANVNLQRGGGNLTNTGDAGLLKQGTGTDPGAQHPYWRSEWMQKMMNLSTVRTHQYAVWVTVGFFEVITQGDPAAAGSANPDAAYDVIGREVGVIGGKNVRHRGFFIVDRLQLGGFDPTSPGKFREAVLYRRIIQ